MIKGKVSLFIFIGVISITFLTACSEYNDPSKESSGIEMFKYEGGGTYKQEVSDKLKIDATVEVPNVSKYPVVVAEKKTLNSGDLLKVLTPNDKLSKIETQEGEVYKSDENSIAIGSNGIIFSNISSDNYASDIQTYAEEGVWEKEDLSFMPRLEAIQLAISTCSKLNIQVNKEPISILAIDSETLKSQEKIVRQKDKEEIDWYIENGKMKPYDLSENDEFYIMKFNSLIEGIPVISHMVTLKTAFSVLPSCEVEIRISKKGIIRFSVTTSVIEEKSVKQEDSKIISIDEAVDKLKENYNSDMLPYKVEVDKISLEYTPSLTEQGENQVELVPTWCFQMKYISKDVNTNTEVSHEQYFDVNAITGKIIK